MWLMIQVVSNPNNNLFPAGAKTLAGKIQAVTLVVCDTFHLYVRFFNMGSQGRTNKCVRQGAKESGQICTS